MRDAREFVILDRLRATRSATVAELAEAAGTSDATIRRDLARLDEQGALRRTHGGAVLVEVDAPFAEVEQVNREAKERIARTAASQIQDGQSVVLDIGTTTLHLAEQLRGRAVTVITANVAAFDVLRDDRSVRLILLPGDWDPVYRSVSGPLTAEPADAARRPRVRGRERHRRQRRPARHDDGPGAHQARHGRDERPGHGARRLLKFPGTGAGRVAPPRR